MPKPIDTYQKWAQAGVLDEKIKTVMELTSRGINQNDIAKVLGVSERTLIKLKRAHPKLNNAFIFGNDELKESLVNAVVKKALGFEYDEVQTTYEESKAGKKKKIVKSHKVALPDMNALKYILIIKCGRNFNEKREEIDAMYKRIDNKEEVWFNENSNKANKRTNKLC
jgi:predicted transcriptional regulator